MSMWCSSRGGFAPGGGHMFEPRQLRSIATLCEKMRYLRKGTGGWLPCGVRPINFFYLLRVDFENPHCWWAPMSLAISVVSLLAGGHMPAKIAIFPGTRLLAGVAPANTKTFYPSGQIISGVVQRHRARMLRPRSLSLHARATPCSPRRPPLARRAHAGRATTPMMALCVPWLSRTTMLQKYPFTPSVKNRRGAFSSTKFPSVPLKHRSKYMYYVLVL
jgi:hypothetical protein